MLVADVKDACSRAPGVIELQNDIFLVFIIVFGWLLAMKKDMETPILEWAKKKNHASCYVHFVYEYK